MTSVSVIDDVPSGPDSSSTFSWSVIGELNSEVPSFSPEGLREYSPFYLIPPDRSGTGSTASNTYRVSGGMVYAGSVLVSTKDVTEISKTFTGYVVCKVELDRDSSSSDGKFKYKLTIECVNCEELADAETSGGDSSLQLLPSPDKFAEKYKDVIYAFILYGFEDGIPKIDYRRTPILPLYN